jgi:hypothetical protein
MGRSQKLAGLHAVEGGEAREARRVDVLAVLDLLQGAGAHPGGLRRVGETGALVEADLLRAVHAATLESGVRHTSEEVDAMSRKYTWLQSKSSRVEKSHATTIDSL